MCKQAQRDGMFKLKRQMEAARDEAHRERGKDIILKPHLQLYGESAQFVTFKFSKQISI